MAKQTVNIGTTANDRTGDSLRTAFTKINANFTELYTQLGLDELPLNLGAFEFTGSTITTTDSSAIVIDQATTVTSDLTVGGDILPNTANGGDLGSLAKPWRSLYVSSSTVYFDGVPVSLDENNNLLVNDVPISQTIIYADIPDAPAAFSGSYADLTNKPTIPADTGDLTNNAGFITATSELVNGEATVSLNSNGELTLPTGISNTGRIINDDAISFKVDNSYWVLSPDGTLTLPIGGTVSGNDDVNITVNNQDSSNYTWNFGNTGTTTFPVGVSIDNQNGDPFVIIRGDEGKAVSLLAQGNTSGGASILWQTDNEFSANTGAASVGVSNFNLGNGTSQVQAAIRVTSYDPAGTANRTKTWTFDEDGSLTIPGDIQSENDVNITVNNQDSSNYTWNFGNTGGLTLPSGTVSIGNPDGVGPEFIVAAADTQTGMLVSGSGLASISWVDTYPTPTSASQLAIDSYGVRLAASADVNNLNSWLFGTDASLTLPGVVKHSTIEKTGGAGSETSTALDLTKSVQVLVSADADDDSWSLADGVEGQIMYFVPKGAGLNNHYINIANVRYFSEGGYTVGPKSWIPFQIDDNLRAEDWRSLAVAVFTDGAWNTDTSWFD